MNQAAKRVDAEGPNAPANRDFLDYGDVPMFYMDYNLLAIAVAGTTWAKFEPDEHVSSLIYADELTDNAAHVWAQVMLRR